jgi:hypothetical protein
MNAGEFYMANVMWLKKACGTPEMKARYNPFDPEEYHPFGVSIKEPKGNKMPTLEELVDAAKA